MSESKSEHDARVLRAGMPPEFMNLSLKELHNVLRTKNLDSSDTQLYPAFGNAKAQVDPLFQETLQKVASTLVHNIPGLKDIHNKSLFHAHLVVHTIARAIHDKCYAGDYGFEFSSKIQPYAVIHENSDPKAEFNDVIFDRNLFNKKSPIGFLFKCKLTEKSCAEYNNKFQSATNSQVAMPFLYKKFDYYYHTKGPYEGCFAFGPMRNICDLVNVPFNATTGQCVFNEEQCATKMGGHYDKETDRCWTGNIEYLFGLLLSDAAMIASRSIEYELNRKCEAEGVPGAFCSMAGTRAIGLVGGTVVHFTNMTGQITAGLFDPDAMAGAIKSTWENVAASAESNFNPGKAEYWTGWADDPLGAATKKAGFALGLVNAGITTFAGGISYVGGKALQGILKVGGVDDKTTELVAEWAPKILEAGFQGVGKGITDFFSGKLF